MERRVYLALVGSMLVGCTGGDSTNTPTTTSTQRSTPTASPAATPTATGTPTDTLTATDTETATKEPTETPTPDHEAIAADLLDEARGHLGTAVDTYTDAGGPNSDWTDVDSRDSIEASRIHLELDRASENLKKATEYVTSAQQSTLNDLRHCLRYIGFVTDRHDRLQAILAATADGIEYTIIEHFDAASDAHGAAATAAEIVAARVSNFREESRPDATGATEALSSGAYTAKLDQIAAESETALVIADQYPNVREGFEDFVAAAEEYMAAEYGQAESKFWNAYQNFEDVLDALPEPPASYAPLVASLICLLDALDEAARELEHSCQLGGDANLEENAHEALASCDLVDESPSASELRDWLE